MKILRMLVAIVVFGMLIGNWQQAIAAEVSVSAPVVVSPAVQILTFKEWKSGEMAKAYNRIARLNSEIATTRRQKGDNFKGIDTLAQKLQLAVQAASVVHRLTIEDYINVYLSQFTPTPIMIQKIAKSLDQKEVADLLTIYFQSRNRVGGGPANVQLASYL